MEPFKEKVWLSSPTMHGEELKYMQDAYEKNWMSTVGENINVVEQLACEKLMSLCGCFICRNSFAYGSKLAGVKPGEKYSAAI